MSTRSRWMRMVLLAALTATGCFAPAVTLNHAQEASVRGDFRRAESLYDRVAAHGGVSPAERSRARLDGGRAALKLGDRAGAEQRLDAAAQLDVGGVSEIALFELAELVRAHDRARAQQLYYRAAAAAERRDQSYPYREAMARLLEMSLANP